MPMNLNELRTIKQAVIEIYKSHTKLKQHPTPRDEFIAVATRNVPRPSSHSWNVSDVTINDEINLTAQLIFPPAKLSPENRKIVIAPA